MFRLAQRERRCALLPWLVALLARHCLAAAAAAAAAAVSQWSLPGLLFLLLSVLVFVA